MGGPIKGEAKPAINAASLRRLVVQIPYSRSTSPRDRNAVPQVARKLDVVALWAAGGASAAKEELVIDVGAVEKPVVLDAPSRRCGSRLSV